MWSFLKQTPRHREVKSSFPCLDSFCLWGRAARCGTGLPLRAGPSDALGKWSLPADLSVYCLWAELAPSVSLGSLDSQELCCCSYWIYADCVCPGRRHILSCSMGLKKLWVPPVCRSSFPWYYIWSADYSQVSPWERGGAEVQENHMQQTDGLLQKATTAAKGIVVWT